MDNTSHDRDERRYVCGIIRYNIYVKIPDLGIQLHEGLLYSRILPLTDYEADAAITLIRAIDSPSDDAFIYFEDDGFAVSLHNYLNCVGSDRSDLADKEAILFINDGEGQMQK